MILRSRLPVVTKSRGSPCQPGERADLTGCRPTTNRERGQIGEQLVARRGGRVQGPKQPQSQGHPVLDKLRQVTAPVQRRASQILSKIQAGKEKVSSKFPTLCKWAAKIEHTVMIGFHKTRQVAEEAARQRGASQESAERTGQVLGTIDVVLAWTVNMPATLAATGSMSAAKASSWIPLASIAYLAYSTARNPLATIRAARKVLRRGHGAGDVIVATGEVKPHVPRRQEQKEHGKADLARNIVDLMERYGDWGQAVLLAALDEAQGDARKALERARLCLSSSQEPGRGTATNVAKARKRTPPEYHPVSVAAAELSHAAHGATHNIQDDLAGHRRAREHATAARTHARDMRPRGHVNEGAHHIDAEWRHRLAEDSHRAAAFRHTREGNHNMANAHLGAAYLHEQAARAHGAASEMHGYEHIPADEHDDDDD